MVLVPSYVEVDGLVVPLRVDREDRRGPAVVRVRHDPDRPQLEGLKYVINAMLARPPAGPWLERLARRESLPMPQELAASPVQAERFDYSEHAEQWQLLTGALPDLADAYHVGATFVRNGLAVPRSTFIRLLEKLFALDAAVLAGKLEPKIDDSIPVPPPLRPPAEPVVPWSDESWQDLEERAWALDERDPLRDELAETDRAPTIARQRRELFDWLEIAWLRTSRGEDDMAARCRELGLRTLLAYDDAASAMLGYVHDQERRAIIAGPVPETPYGGDVSIDVFRLPRPVHPAALPFAGWLARCEAVFVRERGAPEKGAGDLFTRIDGHLVRLRYRPETRNHLVLWRVELV